MSHSARPFSITIISPDTALLQELAWLLSTVGYAVATSKDLDENAPWRHFGQTDFILFDGRSIAEPTETTLAHRSDNPLYRIFLYNPDSNTDLSAWFAAGGNDALRIPVGRGELLARLRTGAQVLELQRRMQSQTSRSRFVGMYSRQGFLRKLHKFTIGGKSKSLRHALLTTAIDFFPGYCREHGELAGRTILETFAACIQESAGPNAIAAYNNDGTFHVLLPNTDLADAQTVAEHLAQKFRGEQSERESGVLLSVATAVAAWQIGDSPEQLLADGIAKLASAGQVGGDCVVEHNPSASDVARWQTELAAGNLFSSATAQDLMEPFTAVLDHEAPNAAVLAALHGAGVAVWPLVDREGRLVAIGSPENTADDVQPNATENGSHAIASKTINHNATLAEVNQAFSKQNCHALVVVAGRRPIGYLSRSSLEALLKPIDSETFATSEPIHDDAKSLRVAARFSDETRFSEDAHFSESARFSALALASAFDPRDSHTPALELLDRAPPREPLDRTVRPAAK
jgi:GGDEF domain-containing protein